MIKNYPQKQINFYLTYVTEYKNEALPQNLKSLIKVLQLKQGKTPKESRSYRPVTLSNVLWNIFEFMTNKRLLLGNRKLDR